MFLFLLFHNLIFFLYCMDRVLLDLDDDGFFHRV